MAYATPIDGQSDRGGMMKLDGWVCHVGMVGRFGPRGLHTLGESILEYLRLSSANDDRHDARKRESIDAFERHVDFEILSSLQSPVMQSHSSNP